MVDLIDAAKRGEIVATTQASNDGENWKAAADVPALADALGLDVSPTSGAEPAPEDADSTPQKKKRSGCAVVGGVCCVLFIFVALGFRFIGLETARRALLASDWGRRVLLESERGRRTICANNLEKVALGVQIYGDLNEVLPPAFTVDAEGKPLHSWRVLILSYLGEETAFPSAGKRRKWEEIADGWGKTLCVVERKTPVCRMDPTRELTLETLAAEVGSGHKSGFNAAFFDGCVGFLPSTIDAATLNVWTTVAGDEKTAEF